MNLTLFPTGGGGDSPPQNDIANYGVFCLANMLFYYLTFHIKGLLNFWWKENLKVFGEPPFRPLKDIKISDFSILNASDSLCLRAKFLAESIGSHEVECFIPSCPENCSYSSVLALTVKPLIPQKCSTTHSDFCINTRPQAFNLECFLDFTWGRNLRQNMPLLRILLFSLKLYDSL